MVKTIIKGLDNISKINKKLLLIQTQINTGSIFKKIGSLVNGSIQRRVQNEGKDKDFRIMKPYTDQYYMFKKNKGRNTSIRDLTFNGKMWQSLSVESARNSARMFFTGVENVNKAKGNQQYSNFFGLSKNEKKLINNEMKKFVKL